MAGGSPIGGDLCSVTVDASTLPHRLSTDWTKFTFDSSYSLVTGTEYAIVVAPVNLTDSEYLQWYQDTNAGYADGLKCISDNNGSTWSQVSSRDCVFKIYADAVQKDNFTTGDAWQAIYNPYYLAQTFIASSNYTVTSVDLQLRRGVATEIVGNVIISIRATDTLPGKPTNPNPEDTDTEVDFSDFTLSWVTGGNTDSYDVWIGDSENLYLCYEGHTETSYTSNWDELITNGSFSDWSFGEPDDWTIRRDFFTKVSQCGDNEGYEDAIQADSGTGLCNIYNSHLFDDTIDVYQYVTLEVGKRYCLSIEINKVVTGELTIWAGVDGIDLDETVNSAATYSWTFRATSETELIAIKSLASTDITIDNVSVILDEIPYDEVIYWEIDAVNEFGTTEGDVWTFDPRPGQVSTFTPLHEATDLTLSEIGSTWVSPSGNTDSYNVYFGLESGSLFFVDETVGLLLDLVSVFPYYDYTYYWAIDAVNRFGVTSGNEVSFTTIGFKPPLPTGMNLDGSGTPTGENNMVTLRKLVVAANSKIWIEDI